MSNTLTARNVLASTTSTTLPPIPTPTTPAVDTTLPPLPTDPPVVTTLGKSYKMYKLKQILYTFILANMNLIIVDELLQRLFARMKESDVDFRQQIPQLITVSVVKT